MRARQILIQPVRHVLRKRLVCGLEAPEECKTGQGGPDHQRRPAKDAGLCRRGDRPDTGRDIARVQNLFDHHATLRTATLAGGAGRSTVFIRLRSRAGSGRRERGRPLLCDCAGRGNRLTRAATCERTTP
jgi:hypothetical protein